MKNLGIILTLFLFINPLWPVRIGVLPEVLKPHMICVSGGEVFVLQGGTVLVYSLQNIRLLRQFGKSGEGPGELREVPFRGNMLWVNHQSVFIDGYDEIIEYSKKGKLLRESRKTYSHFIVQPLGNQFVTLKRQSDKKGRIFFSVTLCNDRFKEIKELFRHKSVTNIKRLELFPDAQNFWTWNDKIFIEKSEQGFVIEVFSSSGERLSRLSKDIKRNPVKAPDRERVIEVLKQDPETKAMGGWEWLKKQLEFHIPDTLPLIREFSAGEGKLYIQTYHMKGSQVEYIILDLSGQVLNRVFLPQPPPVLFDDQLSGRINRYYSFCGDFYYYLWEDLDTENWELHAVNWKEN